MTHAEWECDNPARVLERWRGLLNQRRFEANLTRWIVAAFTGKPPTIEQMIGIGDEEGPDSFEPTPDEQAEVKRRMLESPEAGILYLQSLKIKYGSLAKELPN